MVAIITIGGWLWGKVKQVVKLVIWESLDCPDDEILVYLAFTFSHPVNLADWYSHYMCQFRQVRVISFMEFKDFCLYSQGDTSITTEGCIISRCMTVDKNVNSE